MEAVDALPLDKRVEMFRNLSARAREELIGSVARPGEIMRRISAEEVYFTIKEIGEANALALIAATTGQQLTHVLDLELWKKDMFDTVSAARWLEIISTIGEEKLMQLLQTADPELIVTAMSRFVKVHVRNPDVDLVEQQDSLPQFTLEDIFFVEFLVPYSEQIVANFLETVFHWNTEYYFGLMEELAAGVIMDSEEMAGKWRRSRLADRGFPEFDEAMEIYHYVRRDGVSGPRCDGADGVSEWSEDSIPHTWYPMRVFKEETLFRRSLNEISEPSENDRLSTELAHLANKVMVADGRDPASLEELQGSLKKVGGYINMALEETCGDDVSLATQLLQSNHVEILFRRGFSLILDLRKEAQKMLRNYDGGVENLGHPLAGLVTGLLQKRPYFAGQVLGDRTPREFETLGDVESIRNLLDRSTFEGTWEPF